MIEDKELGLKIAENPKEKWFETRKQELENDINSMECALELSKEMLCIVSGKLQKTKDLNNSYSA